MNVEDLKTLEDRVKSIPLTESNIDEGEEEETYRLTEWGCLYLVLLEYGIDVSNISGRVGKHIVEDFMEAMCKAGYIEEKPNEDCEHE